MCCAAYSMGRDERLDYGSKMIALHDDGPVARFLSKDIRGGRRVAVSNHSTELNAWLDIIPTKLSGRERQC
jgi:hypothetical protein